MVVIDQSIGASLSVMTKLIRTFRIFRKTIPSPEATFYMYIFSYIPFVVVIIIIIIIAMSS